MSHLTDEQLSARLDGALDDAAAARAEAHLAECEACRTRFADLAALEASLPAALTHDPGEAYFVSFADRVSARIAAEAAPVHAPAPAAAKPVAAAPRASWLDWLRTPRGLALAGGTLGLLAVGAIVVQLSRDHGAQEFAAQQAPPRAMGAQAPESAPQAETPQALSVPLTTSAREDAKGTSGESKEVAAKNEAPAPAPAPKPAAAMRGSVQEMKTLENGEQVPVSTGAARQAERRIEQASPNATLKQQQTAQPMGGAALSAPAPAPALAPPPAASNTPGLAEKARAALDKLGATRDARSGNALAPGAPVAGRLGGAQPAREEDALSAPLASAARLCGRVADAQGRAIAGASITLRESGASVVADADGGFCIDAPRADATLLVNAVGYASAEVRGSGRASAQALSVTLQPVAVLEAATPTRALLKTALAPGADAALTLAHDAEIAAQRDRTAEAWSACAERWRTAATLATGATADDARYHAAAARVAALAVTPAAQQSAARALARRELAAYLAHAPAGTQRDQALRWRAQLPR